MNNDAWPSDDSSNTLTRADQIEDVAERIAEQVDGECQERMVVP